MKRKPSAPEPLTIDGKFKCPEHGCLKEPWDTPEAYKMHWYRAHGNLGPQKSGTPKARKYYDPKKARAYYLRRKKARQQGKLVLAKPSRPGAKHTAAYYHSYEYKKELRQRKAKAAAANAIHEEDGILTIDLNTLGLEFLKTCPVCHHEVRLECGTCHTPLGPIIEGIKRALEEREMRHAKTS